MIRKAAKFVLMAAIGAAPMMLTVPAQAQWGNWQNGRDRDASRDYREGYKDGRKDAERGRGARPREGERSYRDGYWAGYNSVRGNRGGYYGNNNGYYGNNGGYYGGNNGYGNYGNGLNAAQQVGYQDGVNDGSRDRQTGHSNRPTEQEAYKHADHNYAYVGGGVDKQSYKNAYRQGYMQGYQQGYNGGGRYRW